MRLWVFFFHSQGNSYHKLLKSYHKLQIHGISHIHINGVLSSKESKRSASGSESLRGDEEGERALRGGAGVGRRDLERPNGGILAMLYLEKKWV